MEIRRNMVSPQVQNVGQPTNETNVGEPKEMQAGETTVKPVDILYTQENNNNKENANGTGLKKSQKPEENALEKSENRDTVVVDEQGLKYIDKDGLERYFM